MIKSEVLNTVDELKLTKHVHKCTQFSTLIERKTVKDVLSTYSKSCLLGWVMSE